MFDPAHPPKYDPDYYEAGAETTYKLAVRVGPRAFQSDGVLDGVLYHDAVHVRQFQSWYTMSNPMMEVRAYDETKAWMMAHGYNAWDIAGLYEARAGYYKQLSAFERWRVGD